MPESSVILLAEDNEDHVLLIWRAFKQSGLGTPLYVVRDGEQAMAYLEGVGPYANRAEYPLPGLLLLDLRMPRKNGFEVLEWIRSHPTLNALRVIVLTTSSDLTDINRAYKLGANSFLTKPEDFENVVNLVSALQRYWLVTDHAPTVTRNDSPSASPPS